MLAHVALEGQDTDRDRHEGNDTSAVLSAGPRGGPPAAPTVASLAVVTYPPAPVSPTPRPVRRRTPDRAPAPRSTRGATTMIVVGAVVLVLALVAGSSA